MRLCFDNTLFEYTQKRVHTYTFIQGAFKKRGILHTVDSTRKSDGPAQ